MRTDRAARRNDRGSVLLHVMLTGIVVALIASTLLRMTMLRYQMGSRSQKVLQEKRDDQAALAAVMTAWNTAVTPSMPNPICGAVPPGFTCGGMTPGVCGCLCTRTVDGVSVKASVNNGACQLTIVSTDIQ